jgi:FHA domain
MANGEEPSIERDKAIERLERELRDALDRNVRAESKLADLSARVHALGSGREETMLLLNETRAELKRVAAERDRLQRELHGIDAMQTETIALPEDEEEEPGMHEAPSINELMLNLNAMMQESGQGRARLSGAAAEQPDVEWREMIPPEVIAPEEFGGVSDGKTAGAKTQRLLVYLDGAYPIKYPIYKEVMTIGRAEDADIQIEGDFISRIHARIVSLPGKAIIEDAGSKNGLKINSTDVQRHDLRHGDVIAIGRLRFTFVEIRADA